MTTTIIRLTATCVDGMTSARVVKELEAEICRRQKLKAESVVIQRFQVLSEDQGGTDFEVEYRTMVEEDARLLSEDEMRVLLELALLLSLLIRIGVSGT